jgi:hypothetical protein
MSAFADERFALGPVSGPFLLFTECGTMGVSPVVNRAPFLSILAALLAAAAVVVPAGNARVGALPTLFVNYTMNCTFTIVDDSGKRVTSIAPGTYQVYVQTPQVFADVDLSGIFDMTACKSFVQFQLTGPGVNLSTTLQQGDEDKDLLSANFQPNGTYTASDLNQPTVARATFSTTATGTPTPSTGAGNTSTGSSSSSKGSTQSSLVGSAVVPFRGNLAATVNASGKLTLTLKGKPVGTLKSGLYTFTVHDNSAKSGFTVQKLKSPATALTGVAYKGTHVKSIQLKAGQWTFFTPSGAKNYFIVAT